MEIHATGMKLLRGSHPVPVVGSPHRDRGFLEQTRRAGRACVMGCEPGR